VDVRGDGYKNEAAQEDEEEGHPTN
jgi:hypothetical protein